MTKENKGMGMLRSILPLLPVTLMLIAALLAGGCTDTGETVEGVGTISRLDDGTYVIQAANGTRYVPVNLDEDYRVDGRVIYFRGVIPEDGGTPESPGIPLEIREIGTYVPPGTNATITLEKVWP